MVHSADMAHAPNFKLALTRVIVPTGRPGAELATLEDGPGCLFFRRLCGLQKPLGCKIPMRSPPGIEARR